MSKTTKEFKDLETATDKGVNSTDLLYDLTSYCSYTVRADYSKKQIIIDFKEYFPVRAADVREVEEMNIYISRLLDLIKITDKMIRASFPKNEDLEEYVPSKNQS